MKISLDTETATVTIEQDGRADTHPLASAEGFAAASRAWLRAGWDAKYVYSFTWMGRPIIQLPEDLLRVQELVFSIRPDVIVETGIAHGGSLVFYASLCKMMDHGRVVGVDVEIRPHNRTAIEAHPLIDRITLIEGSSVEAQTVDRVRQQIRAGERVLVILDSNHTKAHVLAELAAYAPLVTAGSYIIAMDGIMGDLPGAPRTREDWTWNNPREAAREFAARHPAFVVDEPAFLFNEGLVRDRVTYSPGGILKRIG